MMRCPECDARTSIDYDGIEYCPHCGWDEFYYEEDDVLDY